MGLKITQVDAFTSQPFRGNPAAVCIRRSRAMGVGCSWWRER
jgi:predicted PhzF superfamily epimerase YddE/YHI9